MKNTSRQKRNPQTSNKQMKKCMDNIPFKIHTDTQPKIKKTVMRVLRINLLEKSEYFLSQANSHFPNNGLTKSHL